MPKATQTILEIDLDALGHNYRYILSQLQEGTQLMAVVKAFGYGSDAIAVAKELEQLGVPYFAVAYTQEGVQLRDAGIETPILVLHPQEVNFETIITRCLEPCMYSKKTLQAFIAFAEKQEQKTYPVHLKFNTGLNRLGFAKDDVQEVLSAIKSSKAIKLRSVFSHLAASEDLEEKAFTLKQLNAFQEISEEIMAALPYTPFLHTLNTSGILNYPEAHYDMVRCGIGLYGFANDLQTTSQLKLVATLKSVISQIHTLEEGDTLGYNRAFKAQKTTKTATLPIGHADGISRAFGNGVGWVTINGHKARISGNVCMDMIMVDVTGIDCKEGDEVIVFGDANTAEKLANAIDSISYEILTAISQRIQRVIIKR
jgi:alanine racemase